MALEGLWLWKKDTTYRDLYHFWSHIFAVNFAMGVVSGIVMAYQFGTNWSYYSAFAGTITGPLLSYEVLTAFFLEAGFLGVRLFGGKKVGPGMHFFATVMVAGWFFGTDRRCSSGGLAFSRHREFVRLNNNFSLFSRRSNDLLVTCGTLVEASWKMDTKRSSLTRPPKRQSLRQAVRTEAGYAGSTKRLDPHCRTSS